MQSAPSATALIIGTRGSPLALAQAHETRARIAAATGIDPAAIAIEIFRTSGDRIQDRPLSEAGGKGLFTKEIEEALIAGRIDLAVHSSKDMPTLLPEGLELSAFLPREDVRDAFLSPIGTSLFDLPEGALLGTSSLRRRAMARRLRPDLKPVEFRGNVETRLRKLGEGVAHATLLALAGLNRLGLADRATSLLDPDDFLPAVGQGAVAIETRIGDERLASIAAAIDHAPTAIALRAERAFLETLDGSCRTPIGGLATLADGAIDFRGMVLSVDGRRSEAVRIAGPAEDAAAIGREAAQELLARGVADYFRDGPA